MGKGQESWLVKQKASAFNFTHFALNRGEKTTSRNTKSHGRSRCMKQEGGVVLVAEAKHPMAEGTLGRSRDLVR